MSYGHLSLALLIAFINSISPVGGLTRDFRDSSQRVYCGLKFRREQRKRKTQSLFFHLVYTDRHIWEHREAQRSARSARDQMEGIRITSCSSRTLQAMILHSSNHKTV